ncbi:Fatty acid hydroxylase [Penicillium brevicompactum]|uniref:Fatty acid hydroxylase n=1 Tax=Penicillium brevicompactum TaxID=5074 RepID=A0A9W9UAA3_PENBR|nr:Fatty acid hydroxylase [Penicillium brevicompactum]KAJ5366694.1 Fatty acid hydroxylase [Penicillium brevicompactum]
MDVFLDVLDTFVLDRCYAFLSPDPTAIHGNMSLPSAHINRHVQVYYPLQPSKWAEASLWKRDDLSRQALSLYLITWLFAMLMYLLGSLVLYHTLFDKRLLRHPRFLANQIKLEINQGISAIPTITLLTVPFFLAEIKGWSKLYDFTSESPFWGYTLLQYPLFICFTDSGIYWIHRGLHHPLVYRWLHKPHHKWAVPTPFASYAFHPLDGWSQSLPYHIFPMIFPLQKVAYLGLFVFVTLWTVLIHDAEYLPTSEIINGASCHTMHHLYFNYNYGQFTTAWDRLGGTYRRPKGDAFMEAHQKDVKLASKDD